MLFYPILLFIGFVFYKIFIKPLVPLVILKIKLGKQAYFRYFPLVGALHYFKNSLKKNGDFFEDLRTVLRENPHIKVILSNFMDRPFIGFVNSEYIKKMYVEHQNYSKLNILKYEGLLDHGLLMAEAEEWKFERNLLSKFFTFEKLKSRIPIINRITKEQCKSVNQKSSMYFLSFITGQVTLESFFGELSNGLQINGKPAQVEMVDIITDLTLQRLQNPYTQFKLLLFDTKAWFIFPSKNEKEINRRVSLLRETIMNLINKRLQQLRENSQIDLDNANFLDIYILEYLRQESMQLEKKMNIENVVQQFITLFFTGTDTTATMSNTCLYYLAKYPEIQQEIYEEVQQIIQGNEVQDYHLNQLIKMNAFIQEVFRLRNPVFAPIFRIVNNDFQLLDLKLKKGWIVVQRHDIPPVREQHFENAAVFDYKRWLNNKVIIEQDNGFVHIPFGAGGRNCIGQHMALMEIKIILSHILKVYLVKINPNAQIKFNIRFLYSVEPENSLIFEQR